MEKLCRLSLNRKHLTWPEKPPPRRAFKVLKRRVKKMIKKRKPSRGEFAPSRARWHQKK